MASDNVKAAIAGGLAGVAKAFDKLTDYELNKRVKRDLLADEEAITNRKLDKEYEYKTKFAKEMGGMTVPVRDAEGNVIGYSVGGAKGIVKDNPEKVAKTKIPYNEFIKRFNAGEQITSDKFEIVPQSYAGEGSPFVDLGNKRLIKSYRDSFLSDPSIKELKEQGLSLEASNGLVNLAKQGNTVAFKSLGAKQAKVMGERGMLSQSDVTRYTESGQLSRSAGDKLNQWINGVPTDATLDEVQEISSVLKDSFERGIQPYIDKHAQTMSAGMEIPIKEAYRYLAEPIPEVQSSGLRTQKPKSIGAPTSIQTGNNVATNSGMTPEQRRARIAELRANKNKGKR